MDGGRETAPATAGAPVNLDRAVASFLEMRAISWEMGLASLMREGMTREEAARRLAGIWSRASLARERRWRPRRKKRGDGTDR